MGKTTRLEAALRSTAIESMIHRTTHRCGMALGSSAINKWICAGKQPAAARNGYLIVRICLLDVLATCWRYCEPPPFYDSEKGGIVSGCETRAKQQTIRA